MLNKSQTIPQGFSSREFWNIVLLHSYYEHTIMTQHCRRGSDIMTKKYWGKLTRLPVRFPCLFIHSKPGFLTASHYPAIVFATSETFFLSRFSFFLFPYFAIDDRKDGRTDYCSFRAIYWNCFRFKKLNRERKKEKEKAKKIRQTSLGLCDIRLVAIVHNYVLQ